jgi:hypothetical protein
MQANFGTNKVPPLAQMSIASNVGLVGDPNSWQWEVPIQQDPYYWDQYAKQKQPYANPLVPDQGYKQYPWDQNPLGQKKPYQDAFDQEALLKQLAGLQKAKKSAFEEIIDVLFTTTEKEQMLIDMGYELEHKEGLIIRRKLADGTYKTITNSLDDLFLKEVTIKFKNLLLAKASLKLRI